jgi:hypothetical protein
MKTSILTGALLLIASWAPPIAAQQSVPFAGTRVVTVMTRNVSNGVDAEISAIGTATTFPELLQRVAAVYQAYFTRNFPERAAALAGEIGAARPELIGLQEAVLVRTQFPPMARPLPRSRWLSTTSRSCWMRSLPGACAIGPSRKRRTSTPSCRARWASTFATPTAR